MKTATMFFGGMGDAIASSGAAVALSRDRSVEVTTFEGNLPSVTSFFVDYPNITVKGISRVSIQDLKSMLDKEVEHLNGFTAENPEAEKLDFFHRTYLSFGVDYECRWSCSPIRKAAERVKQHIVWSGDYIFLHEDEKRGYMIDREKLPKGCDCFAPGYQPETSILAFKDAIEGAREIHVIDSSFFHLTEQLEPRGKLFLHRYPRPYAQVIHDYATQHTWTEVW